MRALAENLIQYAETHFAGALQRDPAGPVRPILVGPPSGALREMFSDLTANGQGEWRVSVGGRNYDVVVLMVDDEAPPTGTGLSRGCHWDYVVTIRNSCPHVLILSTRGSWDRRPESLANTTETLGELGVISRDDEDVVQLYLYGAAAARLGTSHRQIRELIRLVRAESAKCMSSEHFGHSVWEFKRVSGSSGLKVQAAIAC